MGARRPHGHGDRPLVRTAALLTSLAALVTAGGACSTTYQPQHSGRVGVVIHHGGAMYVKNGHEVPLGPFSGELPALVEETPAAASHAKIAHRQFKIGIPCYLGGAATVLVGVFLFSGPVGWVIIGVGASSIGTGVTFMGAALTHAVDAVAMHNDAVSGSAAPPSKR